MSAWWVHGCEGAAISVSALSAFRAAVARAVWSKKRPWPILLHCWIFGWPLGSDPTFFIIWCFFRQLRRYLAYKPDEEDRIFGLHDHGSSGSPGHGPVHLLADSALEIGLSWDAEQAGWIGPFLPPLRMMAVPFQHFRSAVWQAWQDKVATDLCKRKGFRGEFCFDILGSHQQLASSHLREWDKMLLRTILSGGVWNGFLLSKVKKEDIRWRFCNAPENDGHFLGDDPFHLFVELRNSPEFVPFLNRDRTEWPRCLLWFGRLPGLTSRSLGSPWAVAASDLACHDLE